MKFIKIGCGCTVLVVEKSVTTLAASKVRLIDYCGESEGIRIGPERVLGTHANPDNLTSDKIDEQSEIETAVILDELSELVSDGYRFRELQRILKSVVR